VSRIAVRPETLARKASTTLGLRLEAARPDDRLGAGLVPFEVCPRDPPPPAAVDDEPGDAATAGAA
jgi:hypothetical protein